MADSQQLLLLSHATLVDATAPEPRADLDVLIEGNRIKDIDRQIKTGGTTTVIDLKGLTLMPGLIDAHVHVCAPTLDIGAMRDMSESYIAAYAAHSMKDMLMRGFTTVRDAAGLYDAIVGPTPSSVYTTPTPDTPFTSQIATPPGTLRIGFSAKSALTPTVHPEALAAVEHAAGILTDLGHIVEEIDPPYDDAALSRDFLTIWFASLASQVDDARRRTGAGDKDFEADTLAAAELGRSAGVVAAFSAFERVNDYVKSLSAFHDTYDYFLTPTLAKPPLRIGEISTPPLLQSVSRIMAKVHGGSIVTRTGMIDDLVEQNLGWVPYTQLANLTGRPAINVPLYWTEAGNSGGGLPLGVQFVGALGSDGGLLTLAAQLEQAAPWAHRYIDVAV